MALLTKAQILNGNAIKTADVDCPELSGSVRVRSLTLMESAQVRDLYSNNPAGEAREVGGMLMTIALACIDEEGKQLFSPDDAPELAKLKPDTIVKIFKAVCDLSGSTAQAQEELKKNSELQTEPSCSN